MTTKTQEYRIKFSASGVERVKRDTEGLDRTFASVKSNLGKGLIGGAVFAGLSSVLLRARDEAAAAELVFNELEKSINRSGGSFEGMSGLISATSKELENLTGISETQSLTVLDGLVEKTGLAQRSLDNLRLALDVSADASIGNAGAVHLVSAAIQGNIGALQRYLPGIEGVNLEIIKTKDVATRSSEALKILEERFGGDAARNLDTLSGEWNQLGTEISTFFKIVGKSVNENLEGSTGGITEFISAINVFLENSEKFDFSSQGSITSQVVGGIGQSAKEATSIFGELATAIGSVVVEASKVVGFDAIANDVSAAGKSFVDQAKDIEETQIATEKLAAAQEAAARRQAEANRQRQEELNAVLLQLDRVGVKVRQSIEPLKERNTQIQIFRDLMSDVDQIDASISMQVSAETIGSWDSLRGAIGNVAGAIESGIFNQFQNGGGLFDNLAEAFEDMLTRMAASLAARAALFGFLTLLSGGSAGGLSAFTGLGGSTGSQFGQFVFGGGNLSVGGGGGLAPSFPPAGGGGTTIINIQANDAKSFERYLRENGGADAIRATVGELV